MPNIITRLARLLPLALLLAIPFLAIAQQAAPSAQKWRQAKKTDSARGITYTQFTLAGKFLKWPAGDASIRPTLEVDCTPSETSHESRRQYLHAYLLAGIPLEIKYVEPDEITEGISYYPKINVEYSLDASKVRREQWDPGPDKASATMNKGSLERMIEAHTIVISVDENKAGEVTMQFDMPDSAALVEACDLPNRKK
ncbi:MAG: hypothetical protein ACRD5M_00500 [Candidatus Acidiferrales bacterium]